MLQLRESGLVMYHLRDAITRRTSMSLREVVIEHDVQTDEVRALMLTPLGAGFLLLFVGYFLATLAFFFELKSAKRNISIVEIIQKNLRQKIVNY